VTFRVVVADDERVARQRLVRLVENTRDAEIVAACAGGAAAVDAIIESKPDIVFLDVQMPDLDGFEVLRAVGERASPVIVFVTAFDQYALRAFEVHAVDYLLKPFDTSRFDEAFRRASERARAPRGDDTDARLRALIAQHLESTHREVSPRLERVAVKSNGTLRIVRTTDIDWWETDGNYMRLHVGTASHLVRITANDVEAQLDPNQFARIHRRYIVNLDRIVEIQPWFAGDGVVVLRSGQKLRLSRTYRDRLHSRLVGVKAAVDRSDRP
jgi:two-component system, LytTR family, response regulator